MDVIRKLQLTVDFGSERFQVGQGEWEAMTFNDKHRWVFPLVPNACAYTKLEQYFRKMQARELEVLQTQGDFLESQEVRKVTKSKQNRLRNRMGNFTKLVTDLKDLIQNSLSKAARSISGPSEETAMLGKLREVGKIFDLEEHLTDIQKEKEDLENRKEVVGKEEENSVEN